MFCHLIFSYFFIFFNIIISLIKAVELSSQSKEKHKERKSKWLSKQLVEYVQESRIEKWTTVYPAIHRDKCPAVHTKPSCRYKVCNEALDTKETGSKLAPKGNRVVFRDTQIIVIESYCKKTDFINASVN